MSLKKVQRVVPVDQLKEGVTVKFLIRRQDRETEAFAFKKDGEYFSYLNLCRHWTVGLDFDDNDFFSENGKWLVCKNHGALYSPGSGSCESGPCGGASLYKVPLFVKGGDLYADLEKIDWGEV